jgi:hypothetical protein
MCAMKVSRFFSKWRADLGLWISRKHHSHMVYAAPLQQLTAQGVRTRAMLFGEGSYLLWA